MDPKELAGILGPWSQGADPLYKLLASALQKAILAGDITAGSRLPAERPLAQLLAVSRTTVIAAYDLLRQGEWVERRTGSGTWVRTVSGGRAVQRRDTVAGTLMSNPLYDTLLGRTHPIIDFSEPNTGDPTKLPPGTFSFSDREAEQLFSEHGYAPLGLPALRQAIADRYTLEGLPTTQEQILVTSGAQQAVSLVASLYLQRGDNVLIENPTYAGAIDAFRRAGGRLIPVPVEGNGLRVGLLRNLVKANLPQIMYVAPTCHNPTGTVLREDGRREIAEIAAEYGIPVLEDDTLADLLFDGDAPPPVAAYSQDAPIITVGSMSKLFWAGLRVGWARAPQQVIARLARLKVVADLGTSLIPQAIAVRLLPRTDEFKAKYRQALQPRLDLLSNLLQERLPEWTWSRPAGGTSLWIHLPSADAREFAQVALRYGVLVIPGATMSVDESHSSYVRLSICADHSTMIEGVTRLEEAWATFTRMAGSGRQLANVVV